MCCSADYWSTQCLCELPSFTENCYSEVCLVLPTKDHTRHSPCGARISSKKGKMKKKKIHLQSRPSYSENTQTFFWVVSCRNHLVSGEIQPANPKNCAANYHHSPAEGTTLTFTSCHTEHDPSVSARRVVRLGGFSQHVRGVDGRQFYVALFFVALPIH